MKSMIIWPDGSLQPAPSDSYVYVVPSNSFTFQWDEQAFSWIDSRGDYCYFEIVPMMGHGMVTYKRAGMTPIHNNGSQTGQIIQTYEELSGWKKAGTSQVEHPPICECGAHAVGSKKHSQWCRIYRE